MATEPSYPKQSFAQITGTTAVAAFQAARPRHWIMNPASEDFGWDFLVNIPEGGQVRDLSFFVQVKGSEKPRYINNDEAISLQLELSTLNFLLGTGAPSMIVLCDTGNTSLPVFWVWVKAAVKEIQSLNPNWQTQDTVAVHIPTANRLTGSSNDEIERYVKETNTVKAIERTLGEMLGLDISASPSTDLAKYRYEPENYLQKNVVPLLKSAGLIDTLETESGEAPALLSARDRERFSKLKEATLALSDLRDRDAEKILAALAPQIDDFAEGIKAFYYNCRGVLCLHFGQTNEAQIWYDKALLLRPSEPKYLCNSLFAQFHIWVRTPISERLALPPDWEDKLNTLLQTKPDFVPAIRLKAYHLAQTEGASSAEEYLRSSVAWKVDIVSTLHCAADIRREAGELSQALALLEEVEGTNANLDGSHWELKGSIQLRLGLGKEGKKPKPIIEGSGSTDFNFIQLNSAFISFQKMMKEYGGRGFPLLSEPGVVNYSTVAVLLGKPEQAELYCRQFLEQNPGSEEVQASLAGLLVQQDRAKDALFYLKDLYSKKSGSVSYYKNLAIAFLLTEDFIELLELLHQREKAGFSSTDEEAISRLLAAIALAETGEEVEARKQVALLQQMSSETPRATIAEAEIIRRIYGDKTRASEVYRQGIAQAPNDGFLLTQFVCHLGMATQDNCEELISILTRLSLQRQLFPEEYTILINSYLLIDRPEVAHEILLKASERYPQNPRVLFAKSSVLWRLGNEEEAYQTISQFLKLHSSYGALREAAILANETGRLDEAIVLFERLAKKTSDIHERGHIHAQLYILKRIRKDPGKEILRHVAEFGKTTNGSPEKEAQYFMMFLLTPGEVESGDSEIEVWQEDLQKRIQHFSAAHPNFPGFKAFKVDPSRSTQEQFNEILTEVIAHTLPRELATVSFRLSARNNIWPLTLRAKLLPEFHSIFELWTSCINSKEFSHALHIWHNENNLEKELSSARAAHQICIDITGLLTLAHLDLLDLVLGRFDLIYLCTGTKRTIDAGIYRWDDPHPVAEKIEKWRRDNLHKIRVRDGRPPKSSQLPLHIRDDSRPVTEQDTHSIDVLLGDGMGESLLLARKLNLVLYSDESFIRSVATKEYEVSAISTVSYLRHLTESNALDPIQHWAYMARAIEANFRTIPFDASHLALLTKNIVQHNSGAILSSVLTQHPILGVFIRQFGDTSIDEPSLWRIAVDWWQAVMFDKDLPYQLVSEVMEPTSAKLSVWRTLSGVMHDLKGEDEIRAAGLWAAFLWRCYITDAKVVDKAWLAIKECCQRIFLDPQKRHRILFEKLPERLYKIVMQEPGLSNDARLSLFVQIPLNFPQTDPDRSILEKKFLLLWQRKR